MNKSMATLKQLLPLLLLPLAFVACDKASNPVAPTGSVITLSANPSRISPTGSSTITVTGFRPDGNRLNPGTQIRLATNLGSLSSNVVEIGADGFTSATLKGDGRTGDAAVSAKLTTDSTESTVTVNIATAKPTLTIVPERTELEPGEETWITIFARNEDNVAVGAGEVIQLAATLGNLLLNGVEVNSVTTNSDGRAVFRFKAGSLPGTAKITAFLRNSDVTTSDLTVRDVEANFTATLTPTEVAVNEKVNVTVIVFNGAGRPARGILVTFSNSGAVGTFTAVSGTSSSDGVVNTVFTLTDTNTAVTKFEITVTVGRLPPEKYEVNIRR